MYPPCDGGVPACQTITMISQVKTLIKIKILINAYKVGSACVYVFFFFCLPEGGDPAFGSGGE